jgi:hypothetical protein
MVPSLAFAGAYLLARQQLPRWAKVVIFGLLMVGYLTYLM